jgi:hypothetical protein
MKTYAGSCHCGRVRFEIDADLDHVRVCDCSICRRRGALIHRVEQDRFRVLSDWNELALYQFHTRQAKDYFCKTCGILPFRRPRTAPHLWAVNVRCLEGVDLDSLKVERVFGSQLP